MTDALDSPAPRRRRRSGPATSTRASCSRPTAPARRPRSSTPSPGSAKRRPRPTRTRRWPACPSRPRTCSAPRACPARRARASSRATARPTAPPSCATCRTPGRRCSARPTRTSSPWARRTENSGFGPTLNPWDRDARARRLERRQRGGGGRRPGSVGHRHRHRRLDPPARGAVRDRRAQAHLRRRQPLRDDRLRLQPRPGRAADPRRHRRRPAAAAHGRARPERLDLAAVPGPDRAPDRRAPGRAAARRPAELQQRRHRARRARGLREDRSPWPRSSAPAWTRPRSRTRPTPWPPTT